MPKKSLTPHVISASGRLLQKGDDGLTKIRIILDGSQMPHGELPTLQDLPLDQSRQYKLTGFSPQPDGTCHLEYEEID